MENLFWVGVGSGLALAVHPADDNVNRTLAGSDTADKVFKPGEIFGELGTLLGTAGTVYAGEQPQNSNNPKSVSQYDVACFQQAAH